MNTFGCPSCDSVKTFCSCGALLRCGCGRDHSNHNCSGAMVFSPGIVVNPVQVPTGILPEDFLSETGAKLYRYCNALEKGPETDPLLN
jgi:hypothetical protein